MSATLPNAIPDLWPSEVIVTQVLSPLVILKHQAGQLREKTKNLLEAEVETEIVGTNERHQLVLVVPSLGRYRRGLLTIVHSAEQVYPVTIMMEALRDYNTGGYPEAFGQDEFVTELGLALSSKETKTVIHSLLAKANEVNNVTGVAPE